MTSPSTSYRAYQSSSNYNRHNSDATMSFTIKGYDTFTFYIRSNGESNYDYVIVGLDKMPTIGDNYKDSGMMLYDLQTQHVHAGGSGCGCISLVTLGYVVKSMYENKYNKVLIIATGALMNPVMVCQNENIPGIAHAIVLERVM